MNFSRIQSRLQLVAQLLADLVGEAVAEFREYLAVEDAPYHLIVYISLLGAGTQILTAVLHVEEAEVGIEADEHGVAPVADLSRETVAGEERLQPAGATVEPGTEDPLLLGEYLVDSLRDRLVDELLPDERLCYHGAKVAISG